MEGGSKNGISDAQTRMVTGMMKVSKSLNPRKLQPRIHHLPNSTGFGL